MEPRPKEPLDQVWDAIRLKHYSIRTEQAYTAWITATSCSTTNAIPTKWAAPNRHTPMDGQLLYGSGLRLMEDLRLRVLERKYPDADREWIWQQVSNSNQSKGPPMVGGPL